MFLDDDPLRAAESGAVLAGLGLGVLPAELNEESAALVRRERPALVVLGERSGGSMTSELAPLRSVATELGIPLLMVVKDASNPVELVERLGGVDDWLIRANLASELPARVAALLARRKSPRRTASTGSSWRGNGTAHMMKGAHLLPLIVHDLRTPLNVISLSLKMIATTMRGDDAELEEDLGYAEENLHQIERMLSLLCDYHRLFESPVPLTPFAFSPKRAVEEMLEAGVGIGDSPGNGGNRSQVWVEVMESCPREVALDPTRVRQALEHAMRNTTAAAGGAPVRITLSGRPDRWLIEFAIDAAPPRTVESFALSPDCFVRLCGFAPERRGMDLAIVAKISALFGGSARLEVSENLGTNLLIDWPTSSPQASG
jgi:signal transduction histidine kinase